MGLSIASGYYAMRSRARRSVVDHPPGTGKAPGSNPGESTSCLTSFGQSWTRRPSRTRSVRSVPVSPLFCAASKSASRANRSRCLDLKPYQPQPAQRNHDPTRGMGPVETGRGRDRASNHPRNRPRCEQSRCRRTGTLWVVTRTPTRYGNSGSAARRYNSVAPRPRTTPCFGLENENEHGTNSTSTRSPTGS